MNRVSIRVTDMVCSKRSQYTRIPGWRHAEWRAASILSVVLVAFVCGGCDPVLKVRGAIRADKPPTESNTQALRTNDGNRDGGSNPVSGARVTGRCPDEEVAGVPWTVESDADGSVYFAPGVHPGIPTSCELVVRKPGYEPKIIPVSDVCKSTDVFTGKCVRLVVDVRLQRASTAPGSDRQNSGDDGPDASD